MANIHGIILHKYLIIHLGINILRWTNFFKWQKFGAYMRGEDGRNCSCLAFLQQHKIRRKYINYQDGSLKSLYEEYSKELPIPICESSIGGMSKRMGGRFRNSVVFFTNSEQMFAWLLPRTQRTTQIVLFMEGYFGYSNKPPLPPRAPRCI